MKTRNALAIALSVAGGMIFGALSGIAKVIQDDAFDELKDMAKAKMKEKEESEEGEAAE
jgi:hypothetical protein